MGVSSGEITVDGEVSIKECLEGLFAVDDWLGGYTSLEISACVAASRVG